MPPAATLISKAPEIFDPERFTVCSPESGDGTFHLLALQKIYGHFFFWRLKLSGII